MSGNQPPPQAAVRSIQSSTVARDLEHGAAEARVIGLDVAAPIRERARLEAQGQLRAIFPARPARERTKGPGPCGSRHAIGARRWWLGDHRRRSLATHTGQDEQPRMRQRSRRSLLSIAAVAPCCRSLASIAATVSSPHFHGGALAPFPAHDADCRLEACPSGKRHTLGPGAVESARGARRRGPPKARRNPLGMQKAMARPGFARQTAPGTGAA